MSYHYQKPKCVICGQEFVGYARWDKKTCSDSCRKRLSRQKESAQKAVETALKAIRAVVLLCESEHDDVARIAKGGMASIRGAANCDMLQRHTPPSIKSSPVEIETTSVSQFYFSGNVTAGYDTDKAASINVTTAVVTDKTPAIEVRNQQ